MKDKGIRYFALATALCSVMIVAWIVCRPYINRLFLEIPDVSFVPQSFEKVRPELNISRRPEGMSWQIADKALNNIYSIQPRGGELLYPDISLPLDSLWHYSGIQNESWYYCLHSLFILYDIIFAYGEDQNPEYIALGENIIRSWIAHNPAGGKQIHLNWNDHVTANRAMAVCIYFDFLQSKGLLDNSLKNYIVPGLLEHGLFLTDHLNYYYSHNHGIFEDYAVIMVSAHLSSSNLTGEWQKLASARLKAQIGDTYSRESIHLENSPFYHLEITGLLARILEYFRINGIKPPENLAKLIPEAQIAYESFAMPTGNIVPVGDTPRDKPYPFRTSQWNGYPLIVYSDAGYAVIQGPAYLFFAATGRIQNHKHRDDLSFVLADSNSELITDVGYLDYSDSPENRYSVTWQGHNTVAEKREYSYGYTTSDFSRKTGLTRWGTGSGKSFVEGISIRNSGFAQLRKIYYDLELGLIIIIDNISNSKEGEYYKYLHFPFLDSVDSLSGFSCIVNDTLDIDFWPRSGDLRLISAQTDPLQGWMAVADRGLRPSESLEHAIDDDIENSGIIISGLSNRSSIAKLDKNRVELKGDNFVKIINFQDTVVVDSTFSDSRSEISQFRLSGNRYLDDPKSPKRHGLPISQNSRLKVIGISVLGLIAVLALVFLIKERWRPARIILIILAFAVNMAMLYSIYYRL